FLERSAAPDYAWNAEVIHALAVLPPERLRPLLRGLWGEHGLDDTILTVLARRPDADDRGRFVDGLASSQADVVTACLEALEQLPAKADPDELCHLVLALRRLTDEKEDAPLRDRLAARLRRLTGQDRPGTDRDGWAAWLAGRYPERGRRLLD